MKLNFDGAPRENIGLAGAGAVLRVKDVSFVKDGSFSLVLKANNDAEALAVWNV